jgi:uncharacterized protein (TIGR00297 family)
VPPGTEGAVSLEGTSAGVVAAILYALLALAVGQVDLTGAAICAFAATIANISESYVGAISQDKVSWLNNDIVNVIQISLAAGVAGVLQAVILS